MAEAQMRQLRALMSNVAHDLKAPVACIVAGQYTNYLSPNPHNHNPPQPRP